MDPIKEAFNKIKQDINSLKEEILSLKKEIHEIKSLKENSTDSSQNSTDSSQNSTDSFPDLASNPQILRISTRNQGVSTDRQTDRQTDRHTIKHPSNPPDLSNQDSFNDALEFFNRLDSIKKEIRIKFKKLTNQEFLIFSTVYQFDEDKKDPDYSLISKRTGLTESSIRDYIQRLIKKEIPIEKIKIKNKKVVLHIKKDFKELISLSNLLKLREI